MGRILKQHNVVHPEEALRKSFVQLDKDFIRHAGVCGDIADARAEDDFAVGGDVGRLYDGVVDFAVKAIAHLLSHLREMTVEVVHVMAVDAFAQVRDVLIRSAHVDGVGAREGAVDEVACRCSGEKIDLERAAGFMLAFSLGRKSLSDYFRRPGGGKTRKTQGVAILNHFSGFLSRDVVECHGDIEWFYGLIFFSLCIWDAVFPPR